MIQYKNPILSLLILCLGLFILGCGRMPPEPHWTWTKEDSTAIQMVVNAWRDTFKTTFEDTIINISYYLEGDRDTLRKILRRDMRSFWMIPHYWPRAFTHYISNYQMVDSFIPVKDTTVMVRLTEKMTGKIKIYADSFTRYLRDTVIANNTYPVYASTFTYSGGDSIVENDFKATSVRYLHFDKKNGNWQLKKITGGARIFSPSDQDYEPYLGLCTLRTATKSYPVFLRPDTLKYGIQRFYELDSIMNFPISDSNTFTVRLFPYEATATNYLGYSPRIGLIFLHHKGKRYDLRIPYATQLSLPFTLGWNSVIIEIVPWERLFTRSGYNSFMWSLPIKIKS